MSWLVTTAYHVTPLSLGFFICKVELGLLPYPWVFSRLDILIVNLLSHHHHHPHFVKETESQRGWGGGATRAQTES